MMRGGRGWGCVGPGRAAAGEESWRWKNPVERGIVTVKKYFKIDKLFDLFLCSKSKAMSDKDYQRLRDLAAELLEKARHMTKEEALADLIAVGHLDKDGNFTEPYKHLAAIVTPI